MPKISDLMASGVGGVLPMLMARDYKKQQALDAAAAAEAEAAKAAQAASVGNVGAVAKPMKKGGAARGWGKARGARKAQVY
jgi:hypothetical protein